MALKGSHIFNGLVLALIVGCLALIGREVFKPKAQPAPVVPVQAEPAPAPEQTDKPQPADRISLGESNAG